TPATGPFQAANPATAAQLDSTYSRVMTTTELKTVIGMYRLGLRDSSASAPEFSHPTKPETARAKVKPTRPLIPPGAPPDACRGAPRCPCARASTTTDKMISPRASLQNMMNAARAEITTPRSSSGRVSASPARVTASHPALPQPNSDDTHEPMNTTTAAIVIG